MACFMPFNNRNLEISFFVFRPRGFHADDLIYALKCFSSTAEGLGCVQSSIFQSIHGNMVVWYGAWMKKSSEKKESLSADLLAMLTEVSSTATLVDYSFLNANGGTSRDGSWAAMFSTGDIVSINAAEASIGNVNDLCYAFLAILKSESMKMEGVRAGVCLKCHERTKVACFHVWKSLQSCYSWILNSDYKRTILPYFSQFSPDMKYDVFKVVYVSSDKTANCEYVSVPPHQMLDSEGDARERQIMQN